MPIPSRDPSALFTFLGTSTLVLGTPRREACALVRFIDLSVLFAPLSLHAQTIPARLHV